MMEKMYKLIPAWTSPREDIIYNSKAEMRNSF